MPLEDLTQIVIPLAVFVLAAYVLSVFVRRKLAGLPERGNLLYLVLTIISLAAAIYLAVTWGLFEVLIGVAAAAGAITLIVGLALLPWINDAFAGVALILDPLIKVGAEVELEGKRGRIVEIRLTKTRIAGDECLLIVPNRKFRDELVIIYSTKPQPRMWPQGGGRLINHATTPSPG